MKPSPRDQPQPARAHETDVHCHLGGVGSGDEVGGGEQVEESLVAQPLAAPDEFIAEHADMRGGTAKGGEAEFEKCRKDFDEGFHDWGEWL